MAKLSVEVPEPCRADWGEMQGDEQRRHCAACDKHVHDLSAMTEPEARALLAEPEVCVRFLPGDDGAVRFLPRPSLQAPPPRRRSPLLAVAAAGLLVGLPNAGCGDAQASAAAHDDAPGLITRAAVALYDWLFGEEELNQEYELRDREPTMGPGIFVDDFKRRTPREPPIQWAEKEPLPAPPAPREPAAEPAAAVRGIGQKSHHYTMGVPSRSFDDELRAKRQQALEQELLKVELPDWEPGTRRDAHPEALPAEAPKEAAVMEPQGEEGEPTRRARRRARRLD